MRKSGIRRDLLLLFGLSLTVRLVVAALITRPGYMDPAYYAAGAVNLAEGGGLSEPYIWNYLDDPAGIPHPGFLYWMPLPSLLAAPFAALLPGSFFALQLPFAFLSAALPLVGYVLVCHATGVRRHAWIAGLLVLFSGFFFPHWTLPETFAPFALFGSLALWLAGRRERWASLLGGLFVGLAHLTRADGVILLPIILLAPLLLPRPGTMRRAARAVIGRWLLVAVGYSLVMAPWLIRSLSITGTLFPSGGTKTLWLTSYDDLYGYGRDYSLDSYLAWGWANVWNSKLSAMGVNLQRFLAEDCMVFLLPLAIIGFRRLRHWFSGTISIVYLLLVYLVHSLAFTYPGMRGGFFHASAPVLPFLYVAATEGLEAAVGWVGRRRRWNLCQAQVVFAAAVVVGAVVLSGYVASAKVRAWQGVDRVYEEIGHWLVEREAGDRVVMANNPPAFWYYTRRPAIVVPTSDPQTLLAVADRYGAGYVILDRNAPSQLWGVYTGEESHPRLQPVAEFEEGVSRVVLYEVKR
jgi:4-amino-4-deoxy-L-arabinose transferase-like glycosyltransferase